MFLGMSKVETSLSKRLLLLPDFPCCGGSRMFLGMSKVMRTAVPSVLGLGEWQITWVCHDNHDDGDDDGDDDDGGDDDGGGGNDYSDDDMSSVWGRSEH